MYKRVPFSYISSEAGGSSRGIVGTKLDCGVEVSKFEMQSRYYIHFRTNTHWKRYEPPNSPSYGLNSINAVLLQG